jgi:predicted component of type VI protein secretion system
MGNKHRVKTHRWDRGVLQTFEHWFDSLEEAQLFSGNVNAHAVKVYNPDGEIIESRQMGTLPEQINVRKLPDAEDIAVDLDDDEDDSYSYPDDEDVGYSYPEDNGYFY